MISDDERREVARNIRENYIRGGMGYRTASAYNIALAVGIVPEMLVEDIELWNRLADLIEPGESGQNLDKNRDTVQIESPAVQKAPECDREALLALADKLECDGDCNGCDMGGGIWCGAQVYAARRIREALGVSDD